MIFLAACFFLVAVTTLLARVAGLVLFLFGIGVFAQTGYLFIVSLFFGGNAQTVVPLLVLTLKEQGRFLPRGLVLLSPWTDLTASGKSHESRAEVDPVLDAEYLHEMTENYAHGADCQDPHISPLFADFTGFPAAYIQVGDNEVLLSDSSRLQKNMHRAGVPVRLDVFEGMWHVCQMSPF